MKADYSTFPFEMYNDMELVKMQHESRGIGDKEFVDAILAELGKREKARKKK